MNYRIEVTSVDIGNARRGYHNHNTTVRFVYKVGMSLMTVRELKIVLEIVPNTGMWHKIKELGDHTYMVNHGYDSSD